MRTKIGLGAAIATALLLFAAPAQAQLLGLGGSGGLLGGGSGSSGGLLGGGSGGGGLLGGGGGSGGTSVGVPGVATVSLDSSAGTDVDGSVLGGGGNTLSADLSRVLGGGSGVSVTLPGAGGVLGTDDPTDPVVGTINGVTGDGGLLDTLLGGSGGNDGSNGGDGNNGANGGNGLVRVSSSGGGSVAVGRGLACVGQSGRRLLGFAANERLSRRDVSGWRRASSIQLIPLRLCSDARRTLARAVRMNPNIVAVQNAAARDPLISASLDRSRYDYDNVLAVRRQGSTLSVYVF